MYSFFSFFPQGLYFSPAIFNEIAQSRADSIKKKPYGKNKGGKLGLWQEQGGLENFSQINHRRCVAMYSIFPYTQRLYFLSLHSMKQHNIVLISFKKKLLDLVPHCYHMQGSLETSYLKSTTCTSYYYWSIFSPNSKLKFCGYFMFGSFELYHPPASKQLHCQQTNRTATEKMSFVLYIVHIPLLVLTDHYQLTAIPDSVSSRFRLLLQPKIGNWFCLVGLHSCTSLAH